MIIAPPIHTCCNGAFSQYSVSAKFCSVSIMSESVRRTIESQRSVDSITSSLRESSSPLPRRSGSSSNRSNATSSSDLSSYSYGSITQAGIADHRPAVKKSADGSMVKYQGGLKHSRSWYTYS